MLLIRTPSFTKELDDLRDKYPSLDNILEEEIQNIQKPGANLGSRLSGMKDQARVYKRRLALDGRGKRGGARLIYYCDGDLIVLLAIYAKSAKEAISTKAINDALSSAGLVGVRREKPLS